MADNREEYIDLKKLKQRELLILLHNKVENLEKSNDEIVKSNQQLILKVNTMETKSKVWGGIAGAFSFVLGLIIEYFFKR